jgi:hypothetical protein
LRHVAGARRPDAALEVLGRGERERVPGAAQLEGTDRLKVLELEEDLGGRVVDLEPDERRSEDAFLESLAGSFDLGEGDHSSTSVPIPCSCARR